MIAHPHVSDKDSGYNLRNTNWRGLFRRGYSVLISPPKPVSSDPDDDFDNVHVVYRRLTAG